jgi:hypothetical protein
MAFMDEQMQIESQIGFYVGIIIGVLASWVMVVFFSSWEWYWKVFSSIGQISMVGILSLGLYNAIKMRRRYLEAKKAMETSMNTPQWDYDAGGAFPITEMKGGNNDGKSV